MSILFNVCIMMVIGIIMWCNKKFKVSFIYKGVGVGFGVVNISVG